MYIKLHPPYHLLRFWLTPLFSLIVFLISFASLHAVPKLEVRQVLDKSSVLTGEEIRGTVYLKNSGDEPLKILGGSSTCGCTTLRLKKRLVEPAKEVELHFIVDTRGKLGLIEKTITILIFSVLVFLKRIKELFRLRGFNIWNL